MQSRRFCLSLAAMAASLAIAVAPNAAQAQTTIDTTPAWDGASEIFW
jgi:hypothetical protein